MALTITELTPGFGAEVAGVALASPLDDGAFGRVLAAFHAYAVLAFRDQPIDDEQQIAFSRRFGRLERTLTSALGGGPLIADLSNVDAAGQVVDLESVRGLHLAGNLIWHSDSSFKPVGANISLLSAREVPPAGGETEFADMRVAYQALDEAMKRRLDGLEAEHSYIYSQGQISLELLTEAEKASLPPVRHPVVRTHPETGRKALYIGRHASHIVGLPVEEGRALLAELLDHATRPEFVYRHHWRAGDLVMWDNRCVLHRGRPWDAARYRRVMHRTTVAGDGANPWAA